MQSILDPLFLYATIVSVTAAVILYTRYRSHLAIWGGTFAILLALHTLSYYFVLTGTTTDAAQFWFRIQIIAFSSQLFTWLFFVFTLSWHSNWVNWQNIIIAGSTPVIVIYVTVTKTDITPYLYINNQNVIGALSTMPQQMGWAGYLFIIYGYVVGFLTLGLLVKMLSVDNTLLRNLVFMFCLGISLILLADSLDLLLIYPFAPYSNLEIGYMVLSVLTFFISFLFSTEGLVPIARERIFEQIQDAVLVLDQNNNLVDINQAGEYLIGRSAFTVFGKPLTQIWPQGEALLSQQNGNTIEGEYIFVIDGQEITFDINVSPAIQPITKEQIGKAIVLRNVTGRERMEKALQESTLELTRTNKLITALSTVASHLGSITNSDLILDILSSELNKLGLENAIVTINPDSEAATIRHVSIKPNLTQKFKKLTGISLKNFVVPKHYWPGDRILKEKVAVWYPNPQVILRGLFPQVPDKIAQNVINILGIKSDGQICILPLMADNKVIGALPIWGVDLQPEDNTVLLLFASQVAGILQKAQQYEEERKLNLSLARSKAFTSALSTIAAAFSQRQDKEKIFDILGTELAKLDLGYMIVRLSDDQQSVWVENISTQSDVLSTIQKFTGVNLKGYVIDRKYWESLAEEYFFQGKYLFTDNPIAFTNLVIPKISSGLLKKALDQTLGKIEQKAIYLPLIEGKTAYGILGIWGTDLQEEDAPALSVFASQVTGVLQNAVAYENEIRRSDELARSNSIILALSKVATQLESTSDSSVIFETVGNELKKMGLDSMVGVLDEDKQNLQIRYISVNQETVRWAEKTTGYSLNDLTIPRHLWPTEKVVTEKTAYWEPNRMRATLNMFPILPEKLHKTTMKIAGINMDDPVCYLPIATDYDVVGVLSVWGTGLKQDDVPALSIFTNQVAAAIRNSDLYETETRRSQELDILLKASEATSSSLDLDKVLLSLASQLLDLSGLESCYISEWDKETGKVYSRLDHSRVFWRKEKRDSYSLGDYPRSKEVLLTGNPIILQGDFEAEEKTWMNELGRTAVIILALYAKRKIIGLVEIATTKKEQLFDHQNLLDCKNILKGVAEELVVPLSANSPETLFKIQKLLVFATEAEVCSFSEWDVDRNAILTIAVSADIVWKTGKGLKYDPEKDTAWKLALHEGKASLLVKSDNNESDIKVYDGSDPMTVESLIIFPLQKGDERIGLVELYDFNHKKQVSTEQITLLRTIADKASYWIENARLLELTQRRLNEKETLLKEVHHRVKNNLQLISSLLNLQSLKSTDISTQNAFRESQARLRAMALIHENLYRSQSLAQIDFGGYVKSLATDLFRSYQYNNSNIKLNVHTDEVSLDIDHAVLCGLILNELMINTMKYAFPAGKSGNIWIELRLQSSQKLSLRVADDGIGLPPDFDTKNTKTLGLQLVHSLVNQLEGTLEINHSNGTAILVSFDW